MSLCGGARGIAPLPVNYKFFVSFSKCLIVDLVDYLAFKKRYMMIGITAVAKLGCPLGIFPSSPCRYLTKKNISHCIRYYTNLLFYLSCMLSLWKAATGDAVASLLLFTLNDAFI